MWLIYIIVVAKMGRLYWIRSDHSASQFHLLEENWEHIWRAYFLRCIQKILVTENYRASSRIHILFIDAQCTTKSDKNSFASHLIASRIPFHARGMQFSHVFEFECGTTILISTRTRMCAEVENNFSSVPIIQKCHTLFATSTWMLETIDFYKKTKSTRGVLAVEWMCSRTRTLLGKCELYKNTTVK